MSTYAEFLEGKLKLADLFGFEVSLSEVNPLLKSHQAAIVQWAVRGGRRAIFASFGLGKSMMQIETLRLTLAKAGGGRALIICPLGVRQEFRRDAEKLGITTRFIRRADEVDDADQVYVEGESQPIYLTNYETIRDGKLDPNIFTAVSLDEASVLRGYGTKTYQTFLELFDGVRFRFVATATPSPNRFKELIHYAGFLGIMDTGQSLTRFFQRDSTQANNLTIYPHKEREFWLWLHSWAIFLQKPSDLGPEHSDAGYDLPPLEVVFHEVPVDHAGAVPDRNGQGALFRDAALGVTQAAKEKRETLTARVAKMRAILDADPHSHYLLWHDLEDERRAIKAAVPTAVEVYGSQDLEEREENVIAFSDGKIQYLATKPELSGSGCNFQRHCSKAIFLGVGYQFHDFIQAVHRVYRFLQAERCVIHVIYAASETEILRALNKKWEQHDTMVEAMSAIIREHGLSTIGAEAALGRSMGCERQEMRGDAWTAVNADCVEEAARMESESVGLIVTSVPFSNHYEYTPSYNDFGHTEGNDHFWRQMDFLTPELLRVLQPGRLACIHVKDRILFGNVTGEGVPTVSPFHAEAIFHYRRHGFQYLGMITIVTDVVRENNQTYRLGWTEQCKDGSKMGVGSPEYVVIVRKPQTDKSKSYADCPVVKSKEDYSRARWQTDAHAFWRSSGDRLLTVDELAALNPDKLAKLFTEQSLAGIYSHEDHVRIGEALEARGSLPATFMAIAPGSRHPDVWHDVNRMRTLNGEQSRRGLEFHICPLQFDIVDRLIRRYSNDGDLVLDPFGGLGTVAVCALKMKRRGYSIELNPDYWRDSLRYLRGAEAGLLQPTMFAATETESA